MINQLINLNQISSCLASFEWYFAICHGVKMCMKSISELLQSKLKFYKKVEF